MPQNTVKWSFMNENTLVKRSAMIPRIYFSKKINLKNFGLNAFCQKWAVYRNTFSKANTPKFTKFLDDFKELDNKKISKNTPFSTYFTGDFNANSRSWYPEEGDRNLEEAQLEDFFYSLNLK